MSDIHAIHRKMERFLGYNPDNEIRPDTGAVLDEKERVLEMRRYGKRLVNERDVKGIAMIRYNFKNQTEKYFRYKSRGKK